MVGKDIKKIYIAGKIAGEDYEIIKQKFRFFEQKLMFQKSNIFVINPVNYINKNESWQKAMRKCIKLLCTCDSILLLDDYTSSKGAIIEFAIAKILGIKIMKANNVAFHYKKNIKNIIMFKILRLWLKIFKVFK